jgi:putative Holliday junction resolvase
MALDVGDKTIGVAFTDETGTIAFPDETILRQQGYRRDMAALRRLVEARAVGRIVVGLPLLASGTPGEQAEKTKQFVARLRGSVRIPIDLQDEGYTTAGADSVLDEARTPRSERKRTIDSIAASLILRDYLDRTRLAELRDRQG